MSDTVKVIVSSSGEVVEVYAKAPSSPSGGGITGVGSLNRLTKIVSLVGADGSAIVTVGNSDISDSTYQGIWSKIGDGVISKTIDINVSSLGNALTNIVNLNEGHLVVSSILAGSNLTELRLDPNVAKLKYTALGVDLVSLEINYDDIIVVSPHITAGTYAYFEDIGSGILALRSGSTPGGSGTVTSVSVVTANGISGSVATDTTTPAITLTLGAITPTSVNGLTISTSTGTLTVANGKTLTVSNTLTLTATDGSTLAIGTGGTLGTAAYTAATAYEVPLTFGSGVRRTVNAVANDLITGAAGGQTIAFGTNATDKGIFKATSGNKVTAETNTYRFTSGNNGAQELLRVGDGPTGNTGELGMHAAGQSSTTNYFLRAGTNFTYFNAGTDLRLNIAGTSLINISSTTCNFIQGLTIADAKNIVLNTTTGTKLGTATTQKLAFWNKTPIVQPTTAITAAAFTANTSGIVDDTATFGGYTIGQIAAALINSGILA